MKKKTILWISCIIAVFLALGTYFVLLESNWMICLFGRFAVLAYVTFPVGALVLIIWLLRLLFKEKKLSYFVPISLALIGCLLAFILVNDGFMNKISGDYLRHEQTLTKLSEQYSDYPDGEYLLEENSLRFILPVGRVVCQEIDEGKNACLFLTVDSFDRMEGYVFAPYGAPQEWDDYGVWSDPLDINGNWFYMSMPKE